MAEQLELAHAGLVSFGHRPFLTEVEQLDLAHAGIVSFGHRPILTEVEQLESWRPDVAIVGAPFDISTTNRPGARFGPRAIRATAYEPGTYHLDLGLEIFDWL